MPVMRMATLLAMLSTPITRPSKPTLCSTSLPETGAGVHSMTGTVIAGVRGGAGTGMGARSMTTSMSILLLMVAAVSERREPTTKVKGLMELKAATDATTLPAALMAFQNKGFLAAIAGGEERGERVRGLSTMASRASSGWLLTGEASAAKGLTLLKSVILATGL